MPEPSLFLQLLLVPVLIGVNAFFVAAEYAVVTMRGTRIEELRQQGIEAALLLSRLKEDVRGSLATIQICITATNLLIGAVAEPAMTRLIVLALSPLDFVMPPSVARPIGLFTGLLVVTFFTVVLSELLPKALTLQYTERVALFVARPIEWCCVVCAPMVRLMNWTGNVVVRSLGLKRITIEEPVPTEDELEIMVDRADDAGEFHEEHGELLRRAFDFADLTVRHVMISMDQAGVLPSNWRVEDLAERLHERPYTRWPVRDPVTGRVNGVVNVKMALYAKALSAGEAVILHDLASPPRYLDPDLPLIDALETLRRSRQHLAVVRDKAGIEVGIVTLEDIIESIVGDIPSEPRQPPIQRPL
jgi:putative hemolysin